MIVATATTCGKAPEPPAPKETPAQDTAVEVRPNRLQTRPFLLENPSPDRPSPLIVLLHGYGAPSTSLTAALKLESRARSKGFVYAVPEGTPDHRGLKFWNASTACCNFRDLPVDDVAYLAALIDDVKSRAEIDPNRVYVVGHSNGGFMAHRLACELSDRIAGIASIAGAAIEPAGACRPEQPVAILQIHGDQDWHVPYQGGRVLRRTTGGTHPSATETVARWGRLHGCDDDPVAGESIDLEPDLPGAETEVLRYEGCKGGAAELWTVRGGDHFVAQHGAAYDRIYDFLMAHEAVFTRSRPE
jgi:polyhydroxybutyrate depolymerase